jgi:hypothetical protein
MSEDMLNHIGVHVKEILWNFDEVWIVKFRYLLQSSITKIDEPIGEFLASRHGAHVLDQSDLFEERPSPVVDDGGFSDLHPVSVFNNGQALSEIAAKKENFATVW